MNAITIRRRSRRAPPIDRLISKICMHERAAIELAVEQLLEQLDTLDGDCDLEDDGCAEPSLGWPGESLMQVGNGAMRLDGVGFANLDCELDDSDLEASLGWTLNGAMGVSPFGAPDLELDEAAF
jgi:hypothetical protein